MTLSFWDSPYPCPPSDLPAVASPWSLSGLSRGHWLSPVLLFPPVYSGILGFTLSTFSFHLQETLTSNGPFPTFFYNMSLSFYCISGRKEKKLCAQPVNLNFKIPMLLCLLFYSKERIRTLPSSHYERPRFPKGTASPRISSGEGSFLSPLASRSLVGQ